LFLSFPIGNPITCVHVAFNVQRCWYDCQKLELTFPPVVYSSVYLLFYVFSQNYCSPKNGIQHMPVRVSNRYQCMWQVPAFHCI
jgi:hypothetical protein